MIKQTVVTIVFTTLKGKELEDAIVWSMRPPMGLSRLAGSDDYTCFRINNSANVLPVGGSHDSVFSVESTMRANKQKMQGFDADLLRNWTRDRGKLAGVLYERTRG